jgi:hypothetical protein
MIWMVGQAKYNNSLQWVVNDLMGKIMLLLPPAQS